MKVLVAMMFIIVSRLWQAESNRLTAFKTISMRIRGAKSEMSELGLDTEGMVESTAKLREEIMALSGVDIMLNNNEFKSTYQIMEELAAKWQDLSDIQQATVTELIAGKRQGNIVSSLMNNFDIAQNALETSLNSSGSAMAEHAKWQQSLEAQILKLKAAWQSLSQSFMDSNFLKGAMDAIIGLVDAVNWLIDTFGTLPTLIGAFAAFESFQGVGFFKTIEDEATLSGKRITSTFSDAARQTNEAFSAIGLKKDSSFKTSIDEDIAALNKYKEVVDSASQLGLKVNETTFSKIFENASASAKKFAQDGKLAAEGIDSFVQKQKEAQVATLAQNKSLGNARAIIKEYFSGCKNVEMSQKSFADAVSKTNPQLGKQLVATKSANGAFAGYIASLVGAKIATFALEAATMALNAAITMGISALVSFAIKAFDEMHESASELSERIDEIVTKFNDQQKELVKNKASFESDAERYAELSKGVDNLGRNVSLTTEEYSEYQSVVNSIAEQIPSLISGYDSQGNAILNVKGNVEELVAAYEKLIEAQNREVLTSAGDIAKDFNNSTKKASENTEGWFGWGWTQGLNLGSTKLSTESAKVFKDILNSKDAIAEIDKIISDKPSSPRDPLNQDVYDEVLRDFEALSELLEDAGFEKENGFLNFESDEEHVKRAFKENKNIVSRVLDDFYADLEAETDGMKSVAEAALSNAFDIRTSDYYGMNDTLKNVARQVVNGFDYEFFAGLEADGISVEDYVNDMLDQLDSISGRSTEKIETAFDLQTQFNGGEISYGEYVKGLEDTGKLIDGLGIDEELKTQLKLSIGLNEAGIVDEYQKLVNKLSDHTNYDFDARITSGVAKEFLNSLSAEELSVAIPIITEMSDNDVEESIQDIRDAINREMAVQGLTFDLNFEVEAASIDAFNTALAETVTASGLSSDSISALKGRYAELESQGYDLSAMFEETSNGIHLNRKAVGELERAYAKQKQTSITEDLQSLQKEYDLLTSDINNCNDASERASLYVQRDAIAQQINDAATLAAQYRGLTSAYNDWLAAEEAGQERDMYENIIEGLENIDDEISRGWLDDGTIEFLELLTGKDLSTSSIDDLTAAYKGLNKEIGNSGYSIRDFFTVNEDGDSTNAGVYNFLETIESFDKLKGAIQRDKETGEIEAFNFKVVGGDQAIADALGISEELVQIMVRAADDAGFVVTLDGAYTQLADLKASAEEANDTLKKLGKTDVDFNFGAKSLEDLNGELEKATEVLEQFRNKDGTINMEMEGAEEALEIASYFTATIDKLTEPVYMQLETNQVEKELQEPLTKMQEFERLTKQKHQFELTGDTEDLEKVEAEMDEIATYLDGLDEETQIKLGIDGLSMEEIKSKLEQGEIEIPATVDIQLEMSEDIRDMRLMMMNQLGLISDEQLKLEIEYGIDSSAVEDYTPEQQKAIVEYFVEHDEVDGYTPEQKEALVKFIAETNDLDSYTPEEKQAIVEYLTDSGDPDSWTPEQKEAVAKFKKDSAEVDSYTPEQKEAIAKYIKDSSDPDSYQPDNKDATVTFEKDSSEVDSYNPPNIFRKVFYSLVENGSAAGESAAGKRTGSNLKVSDVNGTANAYGTAGRAFKQGDWSTKKSETALVGELGREIVVTPDNRWHTVGDNGAEFTHIPRGSIVFNHKQTESLLKNGYVTGRGKAYAGGNAFATGGGSFDGYSKRTWFKKGSFEDGWQLFDGLKALIGSYRDLEENATTGAIGIIEKMVDGFAMIGASIQSAEAQKFSTDAAMYYSLAGDQEKGESLGNLATAIAEQAKNETVEFVKQDLIDEESVAKTLLQSELRTKITGIDPAVDSVFGEKSDELAQSAGQVAATAALSPIVPWFVTSGASAWGSEAEAALNQGATFDEANMSGAISAATEILTEKIGGISFGGKTLSGALSDKLTKGISNEFVKKIAEFGLESVLLGEGTEEVFSDFVGRFAQGLIGQGDQKLSETLFSKEAFDSYLDSYIGGFILGEGNNLINLSKAKPNTAKIIEASGKPMTEGLTRNIVTGITSEYADYFEDEAGVVIKNAFRGMKADYGQITSSGYGNGATFYSNSASEAIEYGRGRVVGSDLLMRNPYIVYANGHSWDDIIDNNKFGLKSKEEIIKFFEEFDSVYEAYGILDEIIRKPNNNDSYISSVLRENGHLADLFDVYNGIGEYENWSIEEKVNTYHNRWEKLRKDYKHFKKFEGTTNVNANDVQYRAKRKKHDGAIIFDLKDLSGHPNDQYVVFSEEQIRGTSELVGDSKEKLNASIKARDTLQKDKRVLEKLRDDTPLDNEEKTHFATSKSLKAAKNNFDNYILKIQKKNGYNNLISGIDKQIAIVTDRIQNLSELDLPDKIEQSPIDEYVASENIIHEYQKAMKRAAEYESYFKKYGDKDISTVLKENKSLGYGDEQQKIKDFYDADSFSSYVGLDKLERLMDIISNSDLDLPNKETGGLTKEQLDSFKILQKQNEKYESEKNVNRLIGEMQDAQDNGIKLDALSEYLGLIQAENAKIAAIESEIATIKGSLNQESNINPTPSSTPNSTPVDVVNSEVALQPDTTAIDGWIPNNKDALVMYSADYTNVDTSAPPTKYGTIIYTESGGESGVSNVNGTAFANGTSGKAFKQGDWRTKKTETALVGELGREIVVTPDNRWHTVGDNGAEFVNIPRGSIVFNHKQTEELLANGKVTSGGGRGRAFAGGTAYAMHYKGDSGSTGYGGIGKVTENIAKKFKDTVENAVKKSGSTGSGGGTGKSGGSSKKSSGSGGGSGGSGGGSSKEEKEFEETIDWIETAIDRIERAIDKLDLKANSIYKTWSERNTALADQIGKVGDEIELQQKAYDRYMSEAAEVGLSESYAKKVRDGTIDIETITDEDLKEKIDEYTQWYEKALDCKDSIEELKEQEASLFKQRFENVSAQYEGILGTIEHEKNMLEEYINQSETQGWLVSYNYYRELSSNEKRNIAELEKQKADMVAEFNAAMDSGTITKGSEAYYDMVNAIDEVSLSLEQANTRVMEISQTAQQLKWEQFDLLQDKISAITEETEFLIELMSSDKLFDENGQLTDSGMATMGQHGVAYNVLMQQADQARAEAERLERERARNLYNGTDKYDQDLEERYQELIALQREYILAAEDQKEAIRDLVEEGIQLELDALDEKIEKYKDSLDSARDLYEYNKKVKEQSKEIANLEKQRAAYLGDASEEGKAKLQKIEVSLEEAKTELYETEMDKVIDNTSALLDELYIEYEEILNTRLDNIDALISDMIAEINANASAINGTISEKADSVGYVLSDSMESIWNTNSGEINSVITTYGEKFSSAQTATNSALKTINDNLQSMISQLNTIANTNIKSASVSSAKNYAVGKYDFSDDEVAWTQDGGKEFIVRPSDGAILTPIAKRDSVLTSVASRNIWDMANSPAEFIKDNLGIGSAGVPNNSIVSNSVTQHFENVVFSMPNVRNYNELLAQMQKDPKFEKLVQAMTVDQIAGKSSLSKNKVVK